MGAKAEKRLNTSICMIGANGTGKTHFILELLKKAKENGRHVRVYNPTEEPKFLQSGIKFSEKYIPGKNTQLDTSNLKATESAKLHFQDFCIDVYSRARHCVVVVDDATTVLKYGMNEVLVNCLVRRRQNDQDWIMVFHSGNKVPNSVTDYFTHYIIFATAGVSNNAKDKLPQQVLDMIDEVNYLSKIKKDIHLCRVVEVIDTMPNY